MTILGTWAAPPDLPAKIALGLGAFCALAAVLRRGHTVLEHASKRGFLFFAAMGAALLSVAYVSLYLRGGPRIIDATTYWLQGRALSHGLFAWTPLEPTESFRGRFLLYEGGKVGGIFPPGYPLLLAVGFLARAPMLIGPLLAAALVVLTHRLALAMTKDTATGSPGDEPVARMAAILSVVCGALRYHTADTMSHGATAVGIALALVCALEGRAVLAGLAIGYVVSTRPFSAVPIAIACAFSLRRRAVFALPALLPGIALLLVAEHAVTGRWLASAQSMYYASSDGPPGCFRWGFGENIGCRGEHADFVRDRLPHGYGIVQALGTTVRRLHKHVLDIANFEPLALLVVVPLARASARTRAITIATGLLLLHMLVYLPFYFDGDYPGGGARFFADVLPVEHVLLAIAVAHLAKHLRFDFVRGAFGTIALACFGFAVHAVHDHVMLRDRDGGRPMFEPDELARISLKRALVYVDTDHGFALGHDPTVRPDGGVVIARYRNDSHDRMLYEALGRPLSYLYKLVPDPLATTPEKQPTRRRSGAIRNSATLIPSLQPWSPPEATVMFRFEGEAMWPALTQEHGWAFPAFVDACASMSRALVLTPEVENTPARVTTELAVPMSGSWKVSPHVLRGAGVLRIGDAAEWTWSETTSPCASLPEKELELEAPKITMTIETVANGSGPAAIDYVALRRPSVTNK